MKKLTVYESVDGMRWDTEAECLERDRLMEEISGIMSKLNPKPKDPLCHFANGDGYIQQDLETVQIVRAEIHDLAVKLGSRVNGKRDRPLHRSLNRLRATDSQGREWGQPYFANHPEEAESQEPYTGE